MRKNIFGFLILMTILTGCQKEALMEVYTFSPDCQTDIVFQLKLTPPPVQSATKRVTLPNQESFVIGLDTEIEVSAFEKNRPEVPVPFSTDVLKQCALCAPYVLDKFQGRFVFKEGDYFPTADKASGGTYLRFKFGNSACIDRDRVVSVLSIQNQ
ncbi:MAG: hypothetical protein AAFP89_19900 [Bacteroidota bacterium]